MIFTPGGGLILALRLLLAVIYRSDLTYRYEIWSILVTWLVIAITAVTLSVPSLATGSSTGPEGRVFRPWAERAVKDEAEP